MHKLIILFAIILLPKILFAQTADKTFGDWNVYTIKSDNEKICYISSFAVKESGNYQKRSKPYVLVVNISKNVDELQVTSGYPYQRGSEVELTYGKEKTLLITKHEIAWAKDRATDAKLVDMMKKGDKINVRGVSAKGTFSLDTYSLKGFGNAYKRMKELCGG